MYKQFKTAALTAAIIVFGATGAQAGQITFSITNDAPANGLWLMRPWVGISDGLFTTYTVGVAANSGIKHEAEDGITGDPANLLPPGNGCSGTNYTGSDCLYQLFNAYGGSYSQASIGNPTAPGATISGTLAADPNSASSRYLSYIAMVIPSNDGFFGTPTAAPIQLFDNAGNFLGGPGGFTINIFATDVLDAGTEVNNACSGSADVAFACQAVAGTGTAEGGVVHANTTGFAYLAGLSNGFGGHTNTFTAINDAWVNPTHQIATININFQETPEPSTFVLFGLGIGAVVLAARRRAHAA